MLQIVFLRLPPFPVPVCSSTHQLKPLVPVPHPVFLRLPPFPVPVCSPLCLPWPAPRSLLSPGGVYPSQVHLQLCVLALPSPSSPPNLGIVRSKVSCLVIFRTRARGQGASTPWHLRAPGSLSPCYLEMPAPSRLPGSPTPFPPLPPPLLLLSHPFR